MSAGPICVRNNGHRGQDIAGPLLLPLVADTSLTQETLNKSIFLEQKQDLQYIFSRKLSF